MTNLTETAHYTRKGLKYAGIGLAAFFTLRITISTAISIYKKLNPPPPPPPTVDFGKLDRLKFPRSNYPTDLKYSLQTPSGELPTLSDRAKVYFMPYQRPNLLALERAKTEATQMGYTGEPQAVSSEVYRWRKRTNATSTLEMNIVDGSFTIKYDWQNDQNIFLNISLPGKEQAKIEAKKFLAQSGLDTDDLPTDIAEVFYEKAMTNEIVPAVSLSEADFVRVEMYRNDINEFPVLTPTKEHGIFSIIFTDYANAKMKIVEAEYNYYPVNYDSETTYPIKTADQAWKQLQQGEGYIASWKGENKQVSIRRVYIAYYDSFEPQRFMQPVLVFEGDNEFLAYLPIITEEWYQ